MIEVVRPAAAGGRYRAKAIVGERFAVEADVFHDASALVGATLRFRGPGDARWRRAAMRRGDGDRWAGAFVPDRVGVWRYRVEVWPDRFATWLRDVSAGGPTGRAAERALEEGAAILEACLRTAPAARHGALQQAVARLRGTRAGADALSDLCDDPVVQAAAGHRAPTASAACAGPTLEVVVDRPRARFGAWYEFFPRSTGAGGAHGTLRTARARLPAIAEMGFDVVYLPPIHPIGVRNRKGRNNALTAEPGDVGSPWAVGGAAGGHTAVHPDLGTMADFDAFVAEAHRLGMEVALDLAFQCSPDHPWVRRHPGWFHRYPDGSLKYAANGPKRYEDVCPLDFDAPDREALWRELKRVVEFWVGHGVRAYRVDNPHLKPFGFWEWLIGSLKRDHPDLIFLAESFTRPALVHALARLGFTQCYGDLIWCRSKAEIVRYMTQATAPDVAPYLRLNSFVNTPDILPEYLQGGGPAAFKIRLVLAALLSPSYGMYSGYELCEDAALVPGGPNYRDSEKYELRPRDFGAPGTLSPYVAGINAIRRRHRALSGASRLCFHDTDDDEVIAFSRTARDGDAVLAVVTLDPSRPREVELRPDLRALGLDPSAAHPVVELLSGSRATWSGAPRRLRLDPGDEPARIFAVGRACGPGVRRR